MPRTPKDVSATDEPAVPSLPWRRTLLLGLRCFAQEGAVRPEIAFGCFDRPSAVRGKPGLFSKSKEFSIDLPALPNV